MSTRSTARSGRGGAPARDTPRRPWWRRWWMLLLVLPALALGAVGLLAFYLVFSSVPLPEDITARSSVVYDVHGEEVGGLASDVAREDIAIETLPSHVLDAVIAAEDRRFYDHNGISVTGIARALFTNVRAGSVQQGGSTITQQYLKNAALTPEQSYRRKVEEAALAIKMEREYTKDEILASYLNTIYWGRGTYGIEAASRTLFDTAAKDLDVNQAATLAGMIAAPEAFDPLEDPARADTRRRFVLDGMLQIDALTQDEHDRWVEEGLPEVTSRLVIDRGPTAYYLDAVRRELSAQPEFAQGELFRGLRIHTELDPRMQQAAQETLTAAVQDGPADSGAIVTIDPTTGGVRALVGGPDIDRQPFNVATRAVRQVGSTFKAFTLQAYVEAGNSPETSWPAPAQLEIEDAGQPIGNFGGASFGQQTVRQATASSTNTVFVQLQEEVGREAVLDAAHRAGLPRDKAEEPFPTERADGPAMQPLAGLTLGQDGFSPLELTSAFGTFAAEGVRAAPRLVARVEDDRGRILFEPDDGTRQAVEPDVARHVTDVLAGAVANGSGRAAALEGRPVAGKTGTTSEGRDVWFAGYVPQLATAVWLGNLDNTPIDADNATGGGLAAPVWGTYMARATEGLDVEAFTPPSDDLAPPAAEACPDGYDFADPPSEADEDGFFPDVLVDRTDAEGRPCVETKPELAPCPEGFAFADPPAEPDEDGRMPEVLDEPRDFQGRPCVEILEDQAPDEPDDGDPGDGTDPGEDAPDGDGSDGDGSDGDGSDGDGSDGDGSDDEEPVDEEPADGGTDDGDGDATDSETPGGT